jgi:hypothetical protein
VKILCLLFLASLLVLGSGTVILAKTAATNDPPTRPELINTAPGNLTEEEIERANQEEARRWSQILLEPQWTYPESMILNVPHHIQQETYWCGPASVLAMTDYNGRVAQVSGTSEYEKQNTIAIQSGTTTSGSNTLYLRNTLNN